MVQCRPPCVCMCMCMCTLQGRGGRWGGTLNNINWISGGIFFALRCWLRCVYQICNARKVCIRSPVRSFQEATESDEYCIIVHFTALTAP